MGWHWLHPQRLQGAPSRSPQSTRPAPGCPEASCPAHPPHPGSCKVMLGQVEAGSSNWPRAGPEPCPILSRLGPVPMGASVLRAGAEQVWPGTAGGGPSQAGPCSQVTPDAGCSSGDPRPADSPGPAPDVSWVDKESRAEGQGSSVAGPTFNPSPTKRGTRWGWGPRTLLPQVTRPTSPQGCPSSTTSRSLAIPSREAPRPGLGPSMLASMLRC